MTIVGFIKESNFLQDTEKLEKDIKQFVNQMGFKNVLIVKENLSNKSNFKEGRLGKIIESMLPDDILIVPELSRLAGSTTQILEVIKITKEKGIILYSLKENFNNYDSSITLDMANIIFNLVSNIEKGLVSLRTKEALHARKEAGVKLGRPKGKGKSKLDAHKDDILKLISLGVPKTLVAKQYQTTTGNLYNFLNRLKDLECEITEKFPEFIEY